MGTYCKLAATLARPGRARAEACDQEQGSDNATGRDGQADWRRRPHIGRLHCHTPPGSKLVRRGTVWEPPAIDRRHEPRGETPVSTWSKAPLLAGPMRHQRISRADHWFALWFANVRFKFLSLILHQLFIDDEGAEIICKLIVKDWLQASRWLDVLADGPSSKSRLLVDFGI